MATIRNLVNGALRRLRSIAPDETATGVNASVALSDLNEMMHALKLQGADTQWDDVTLNTQFPLGNHHVQGVKALLCKRMAEERGKPIGAVLAEDARRGLEALQSEYGNEENLRFDDGLMNMPQNRQRYHA